MTSNSQATTNHQGARPKGGRARVLFLLLVLGLAVLAMLRLPRGEAWKVAGLEMPQRLALAYDREGIRSRYSSPPEEIQARLSELGDNEASRERIRLQIEMGIAESVRGDISKGTRILQSVLDRLTALELVDDSLRRRVWGRLVGAYLREGELDNCIANHNRDSCLMPIQGGGVHHNPGPSQRAIALLESELVRRPDDLMAIWLLNIAHMTVGDYPQAVPEPWRIDPSTFASEYELPRFFDVAHHKGVAGNGLSGGTAIDDFDGDGDLDLVASSWSDDEPMEFYRNDGPGGFVDAAEEAGLSGLVGGLNLNHADFDNDGLNDLLVLRGAWKGSLGDLPNSLLANRGGRFVDVTESAGLLSYHPTQNAAWGDYDNDGWLDLFIGNESKPDNLHPCELYHNNTDGTFTDVIGESGIDPLGFVKGSAWGDFDNDGRLDLFVSKRAKYEEFTGNRLYRNVDGGAHLPSFEDVTEAAGLKDDFWSFPCWFFDYDNDGWQDIFVAAYAINYFDAGSSDTQQHDRLSDIPAARMGLPTQRDGYPRLYHNLGDGKFEDVAPSLGLARVILVMGANFGDIDNDGWLDIYLGTGNPDYRALMANRMFRNDRGRRFQDVTTVGGFGHLQKGHGIAFGDVDSDGDQDLFVGLGGAYPNDYFPNVLFENPGNDNHWVTLLLRGQQSNRSAIGARVKAVLTVGGTAREIHRTVGTGGSFGSSSLQVELGLGAADSLDRIEIRWPGGDEVQVLRGLEMDDSYIVEEHGRVLHVH